MLIEKNKLLRCEYKKWFIKDWKFGIEMGDESEESEKKQCDFELKRRVCENEMNESTLSVMKQ